MKDMPALIDEYLHWLRQNMAGDHVTDNVYEITTPFLDRHNDHVQIYVQQTDEGYLLSDDGYTISDLAMTGFVFNTPSRKEQLRLALSGFGISCENYVLCCRATPANFPQRKHSLIQAILAVDDMHVLSRTTIASVFREDVARYLTLNDIRFIANRGIVGHSGMNHNFDIAIPASRQQPERLLRVVNSLNRERTIDILFSWQDTRASRPSEAKLFVISNNISARDATDAFREYNIPLLRWDEKERFLPDLSA